MSRKTNLVLSEDDYRFIRESMVTGLNMSEVVSIALAVARPHLKKLVHPLTSYTELESLQITPDNICRFVQQRQAEARRQRINGGNK